VTPRHRHSDPRHQDDVVGGATRQEEAVEQSREAADGEMEKQNK